MAESIHETNSQGLTQETSQQRLIRREKLAKLQEEGNDPFQITRYVVDNDSANIKEHFDALEGSQVSIAGRLMSKRGMGKVSFCDLQDKSGPSSTPGRTRWMRRSTTVSRSTTSATS